MENTTGLEQPTAGMSLKQLESLLYVLRALGLLQLAVSGDTHYFDVYLVI